MARSLTIVGASARAAAYSARTAGFQPYCADLFADVDLQAISAADRLTDYPHGLVRYLHASPQVPWMYTGALENYPHLIDELGQLRPLYGNAGSALRRARDPLFWSRTLTEAGLAAPRVSTSAAGLPSDGTWFRKPLCSAHGRNVSPWTSELEDRKTPGDGEQWYFQERIEGVPIAAIFVAADGEAAILGVTQQLIGEDWRTVLTAIQNSQLTSEAIRDRTPAKPAESSSFRYAGAVGPLMLDDRHFHTLEHIGQVLSRTCGLVGLFGVDLICNERNVWPVEINPRYTASIEVLERASAVRTKIRRARRLLSIEWHEAACCFRQLPAPLGQSTEAIAGKLIYYAQRDTCFSPAAARWAAEGNLLRPRPVVADIPAEDTTFRRGEPILTLLADGGDAQAVCEELSRAAQELEAVI